MTDNIKSSTRVGYGKPPDHKKFKKGQSGNPSGRPRGSRNIHKSIRDSLDETVVITEGGRSRRIRKVELSVKKLVMKAMTGDLKAIEMCLAYLADHDSAQPPEWKVLVLPDGADGGRA